MLSTVYERETGQRIYFDMYSYGELEQILYKQAAEKEKHYDGFMIDITWLGGLVESGGLKKLDHVLEEHNGYFSGFVDGIMKDYGMYENSLYAVPFMPGAQMLFYQKDLFEDRSFQIRFQRKYKERLQPPASWSHFNAIAEFFTREYTPDSPVQYGVSMSMGGNVYMAIDFLDRLWSYGGSVFDEFGRVSINRGSAADALKSLMRSYTTY